MSSLGTIRYTTRMCTKLILQTLKAHGNVSTTMAQRQSKNIFIHFDFNISYEGSCSL